MRHGKKFNHLGRKSAHRKAMLANMACSLIEHKRINTTLAKAKALKLYVEPIITKSKTDSMHSRRVVFSYLKNKYVVSELFRDVAAKVGDRPGGYTRIIKLGNRLGDNAEMCFIELVDYNDLMLKESSPKKKKSTRRRGAKKKVASIEASTSEELVANPAAESMDTSDAEILEVTQSEAAVKADDADTKGADQIKEEEKKDNDSEPESKE